MFPRHYVYLHGFASGPRSYKAQYLLQQFAQRQIRLELPDLNQGNFFSLTLTRQIEQVRQLLAQIAADGDDITLIGSSLGGLVATWVAENYPQVRRLVLLAPAFGFLSHWLPRLSAEQRLQWQIENQWMIYHYSEQRSLPLSYGFVEDCCRYADESQLKRQIPTLILHGSQDQVIPIAASYRYVAHHFPTKLMVLRDDHALSQTLPEIWTHIQTFCDL